MLEILSFGYLWIKSLHIIAVICWMAGLFYLPRLFVYHVEKSTNENDKVFQEMEVKLLRFIMNPALIVTWVCGILLAITPGIIDFTLIWPYLKLASVLAMSWFHHWLGMRRKDFFLGQNTLTGRQYRLMNEVPTALLVIIVVSVVVKF